MRYVGGKSRHAVAIADVIDRYRGNQSTIYEPFCGGGALTSVLSRRYSRVLASDYHHDLIVMWQALKAGWSPPSHIDEAEYQRIKQAEPSALRGFAGFACAFGGEWLGTYARGAGRNYCQEAKRNLAKIYLANVEHQHASFFDLDFAEPADRVIYCDPPYRATQGYSTGAFDHAAFWRRCDELHSAGFLVAVSEYEAPADWSCVWSQVTYVQLAHAKRKRAAERLFIRHPRPIWFMDI